MGFLAFEMQSKLTVNKWLIFMLQGQGACQFKQGMEEGQELDYLSFESEIQIDAAVRRALVFPSEENQVQIENGVDGSSGVADGISPGSLTVLHSAKNNISGNGLDSVMTTENNNILLNMDGSLVKNVEASVIITLAPLENPISCGKL